MHVGIHVLSRLKTISGISRQKSLVDREEGEKQLSSEAGLPELAGDRRCNKLVHSRCKDHEGHSECRATRKMRIPLGCRTYIQQVECYILTGSPSSTMLDVSYSVIFWINRKPQRHGGIVRGRATRARQTTPK